MGRYDRRRNLSSVAVMSERRTTARRSRALDECLKDPSDEVVAGLSPLELGHLQSVEGRVGTQRLAGLTADDHPHVVVDELDHIFDWRSRSAPKRDAATFRCHSLGAAQRFHVSTVSTRAHHRWSAPAGGRYPAQPTKPVPHRLGSAPASRRPNRSLPTVTHTHAHDRATSAQPAHAAWRGNSHVLSCSIPSRIRASARSAVIHSRGRGKAKPGL